MKMVKTKTPWGIAQKMKVVCPGIIHYSTASHGGYHLDEPTNDKIPTSIKRATFGQLGLKGWYEEDLDWAFVVLFFPKNFDAEKFDLARNSVQLHAPNVWAEIQTLI